MHSGSQSSGATAPEHAAPGESPGTDSSMDSSMKPKELLEDNVLAEMESGQSRVELAARPGAEDRQELPGDVGMPGTAK